MTVVAVELEDSVAIDLKQTAELLRINELDVIRRAVANYLRQVKMDQIRTQVLPYAQAAGFLSEDDIYREVS